MRAYLFTAFTLALEVLVILHWRLWPHNAVLGGVALVAGIVMVALCTLGVVAFVELLRRDPADPRERGILRELRWVEGVMLLGNAGHVVFTVFAFLQGVYWVAVPMALGLAAEGGSVLYGRLRAPPDAVHQRP